MVIGAVIIKQKLGLSDRETVSQIQENPYPQYFTGLAGYQMKVPFVPSLLVEVCKRMRDAVFEIFHQAIIEAVEEAQAVPRRKVGDDTKETQPTQSAGHQSQSKTSARTQP